MICWHNACSPRLLCKRLQLNSLGRPERNSIRVPNCPSAPSQPSTRDSTPCDAGEALNEFSAIGLWPEFTVRQSRVKEAVELIRALWTGEIARKGMSILPISV